MRELARAMRSHEISNEREIQNRTLKAAEVGGRARAVDAKAAAKKIGPAPRSWPSRFANQA